MRIFGRSRAQWRDREQFATCLRRILEHVVIQQWRMAKAAKRGSGLAAVSAIDSVPAQNDDLAAVDARDAIERVAALDPEAFRMVEMYVVERRAYADIALLLARSPRSVEYRIGTFLVAARRSHAGAW